jgi:hypothetical protein
VVSPDSTDSYTDRTSIAFENQTHPTHRSPASFPLTNPRQRPPLPKFKWSLNTFLSSDDPDVDLATLEQNAEAEAEILERVERFRRDGRFLPGAETLFGNKHDVSE